MVSTGRFIMQHCLLLCAIVLQAATCSAAGRPSLETVNGGVMQQALKDLPAEFDDCQEIIFVQRGAYADPHWYANIAYFCDDENQPAYTRGAQLCKLNLKTGSVSVLLAADAGCIRDAKVHYDAKKILFAWRKDDSEYYHLYEINVDGGGLRQITSGPFDDYEPEYLPDGGIVFVSTRAKCWVGCWKTQVGTIHRCDADGANIRALSCNIEHDNTPAVLPNGQILYMRWEYVDRSQVEYHHLWTMNPDGTGQAVYYGNETSWGVFIDCRPVPGDDRVMGIYSPGHGRRDHYGWLSFLSTRHCPEYPKCLEHIEFTWGKATLADPWPMSANTILVADQSKSRVIIAEKTKDKYTARILYEIKNNDRKWIAQSPRPILPRPRERVIADRSDQSSPTGKQVMVDIYDSRGVKGVKRGEIKKLLVIETLAKPVNFSGGPDTLSFLGSFNLERILGTVPVEPDGSAYFELPANRPVFYVALDEKNLSVKRMQSFTCVMPGETMTCLGCHETRRHSRTSVGDAGRIMATQRAASPITPVPGAPDVPDFIRDVQPVLDKYCIRCHNTKDRKGRLSLEGDMGHTFSISYYSLLMRNQVADGRNGLGNQPIRSLGSSASPLLRKLEGKHHNVKADHADWIKVWAWTEAASAFCGTYGGLRNGAQQDTKIGAFAGPAQRIFQKRCHSCHNPNGKGPNNRIPEGYDQNKRKRQIKRPTAQHERLVLENDPLRYYSFNVIVNATRPEKSAVLMAPLTKAAGGWGACGDIFKSKDDPDYKALAQAAKNWQGEWLKARRFGAPNFQVNRQYIREMVRFGILPEGTTPDKVDAYKTDRQYWQMFTHQPDSKKQLTSHLP